MIYKGMVLRLEQNYAIVMTDDAQYVKVLKKAGIRVGKQILFLDEDIYREKKIDILKHYSYAAVFIIFLISSFMLLNFNNIYMPKTTAAVVTMDINPSIELEIDNKEKVIKITPINQEAHEIINRNLLKKKVDQVIEALLINAEAHRYFEQQDSMVLLSLTILNKDSNISLDSIRSQVELILKKDALLKEINIAYIDAESTVLEKARANGMSIGRYKLYEEIMEYSSNITIESAKTMKLGELVNRHRYRGTPPYESITNPDGEEPVITQTDSDASKQTQQQTRTQTCECTDEGNKNRNMGSEGGEQKRQGTKDIQDEYQTENGRQQHGDDMFHNETGEPEIISPEESISSENNQQGDQQNSQESRYGSIDAPQQNETGQGSPRENGTEQGKSEGDGAEQGKPENDESEQDKQEEVDTENNHGGSNQEMQRNTSPNEKGPNQSRQSEGEKQETKKRACTN